MTVTAVVISGSPKDRPNNVFEGNESMELAGQQLIPASLQKTWEALNDPDTLKSCIGGCKSIEQTDTDEYQVVMVAKIGPVSATFKGKLKLEDLQPPHSYTLRFEGQGGVAGFGKGTAEVQLSEEAEGTLLQYNAKAQVGGKIAQIGSRLVDSTAKKLADEFFAAFKAQFDSATAADPQG